MPTETPLTDEINALTQYANTITGASDTCLSDAVATLADGYGGGGASLTDVLTGAFPTGEIDISGLTLSAYCGAYRTGITKITGTGVTATTGRNFQGCTGITDIHVHFTSANSADLFAQCTNLKTAVVIVDGTNQAQGYFNGCTKLETADLTMSRFRNNTFYNNTKLTKIILRQTTPTTMEVANLLNFTPFKSGGTGGEIYIPKALYDHLGDGTANDYKSLTYWSTYEGYGTITWKKIEGSIYETQYADGTPIV